MALLEEVYHRWQALGCKSLILFPVCPLPHPPSIRCELSAATPVTEACLPAAVLPGSDGDQRLSLWNHKPKQMLPSFCKLSWSWCFDYHNRKVTHTLSFSYTHTHSQTHAHARAHAHAHGEGQKGRQTQSSTMFLLRASSTVQKAEQQLKKACLPLP